MQFRGGTIQAGRYGQTNPKDYAGLIGWWHTREGLTYYRGDQVYSLSDLSGSGTGKALMPPSGITNIGRIANTPYGLGLCSTSGGQAVSRTASNAFNFLADGSPFTFILIYKNVNNSDSISISSSGGNVSSLGMNWSPATTFSGTRFYNASGSSIITNGNFTEPTGNSVASMVSYGYNRGISPPMVRSHNGVVLTSHNFNSAPTTPASSSYFQLSIIANPTNIAYFYEMIIYNNTGKSKTQIDFEMSSLYSNYIKVKYKNFV